jgi:hypothetical protein
MKTVRPFLAALCALFFLAACDTTDPEDPEGRDREFPDGVVTQALTSSSNLVARIDAKTGKITILENRLRKSFQDGGPIRSFQVARFVDGYNLIRIGTSADGACRTEVVQLEQSGTGLNLKLEFEVAYILPCRSFKCPANTGQCYVSFNKQTCPCDAGGDCSLGSLQAAGRDVIFI